MGKINLLDTSLSNMIAAGEVVEKPVSVVKELVENAIDAGATNITVEIDKGGIKLIRVTDNGSGIEADDISAAFLPHATSKIKSPEDLDAIFTLGFRGEALASIASISRLQCTSKTYDAQNGICASFEGGEMTDVVECGAANGTTVIVRDLFYNTPARMKFLKKDATEASYIADIMSRFILANTNISFKLINSKKQIFFSPGDGVLKNAVYCVYGKDYADGLIDINHETDYGIITGVCGKTNISRANRGYQSFFINGRNIKSPLLTTAVEQAYKNQLMVGKFPVCAINIKLNPSLVDVNVHPSKQEVKFSNEKSIFDGIYWAVKNSLYAVKPVFQVDMEKSTHLSTDFDNVGKKEFVNVASYQNNLVVDEKKEGRRFEKELVNQNSTKAFKTIDINQHLIDKAVEKQGEFIYSPVQKSNSQHKLEENSEVKYETKLNIPIAQEENSSIVKQQEMSMAETYKIVGQVFSTYIIIEKFDKILLLDQHAAHERLYFEELKKEYSQHKISSQSLLSPVVINLSSSEYSIAIDEKIIGEFLSLGFEIEDFGINTLAVRMVPMNLNENDIKEIIASFIEFFSSNNTLDHIILKEKALHMMACKKAIKANMSISTYEMESLVRAVFDLDGINTCPHGRPIIVEMSKKDIEKEFKRII